MIFRVSTLFKIKKNLKKIWTLITSATEKGHLEIVKYFIEEVKDIELEPMDHDGLRPIHVAVRFGHLG